MIVGARQSAGSKPSDPGNRGRTWVTARGMGVDTPAEEARGAGLKHTVTVRVAGAVREVGAQTPEGVDGS